VQSKSETSSSSESWGGINAAKLLLGMCDECDLPMAFGCTC
jgi:hypothetical protein